MQPTRVLLVRHGDSHHKVDDVNGGPRACRGLTDLGREQVAGLRDRFLASHEITGPVTVYSSMIPRAIETAEILAQAFGGAEVLRDCGLCTYHLPEWADGMSWEEINREHAVPGGGMFHPFQEGNEAWTDLAMRVSKALTRIAARHAGQNVLIATHAEAVQASLITFGMLPIYRHFEVRVSAASVTEWTTDDDPSAPWESSADPRLPVRWTLARLNDAAHAAHAARAAHAVPGPSALGPAGSATRR